ncbi:cupin domain-containing protein, partial [Haloarculaceae archaeon H-GB1-1]|nr:cupin domain-containing protein [Haloarculaceae archaeon H-GB1-1]
TSLDDLDESTHATVFPDDPRTVRLSLDAGESVPEHDHPDTDVLFHVLSGSFEVTVGDETYAVETGDLLRFDGARSVSPAAVTDATALVVLAPQR